jgi:hypothetical protein
MSNPGPIALFGSGETAPNGRKVFHALLERLPDKPAVSFLETPAGFELNSPRVAGNVAEFLEHSLQNFNPQTTLIPARKKGTPFSPNDPEILEPILKADLVFMGPGSPTYAVRQLTDSLAWEYLVARHRLGAGLALASASAIAVSSFALPVYEIYKVGLDIHWREGLNLLGAYQLPMVFIPHWNNQEGGENLDTSRCFMGKARFEPLQKMLPPDQTILGLDEHTGMILDFEQEHCEVIGLGRAIILRAGKRQTFSAGNSFPIQELGPFQVPDPETGLNPAVWERAQENALSAPEPSSRPSREVLDLVEKRQSARTENDWDAADRLREEIESLGWEIQDTPEGPQLHKR